MKREKSIRQILSRLPLFACLPALLIAISACGSGDSHMARPLSGDKNANNKSFDVDTQNEPPLLPEKLNPYRPQLPDKPPVIETPIDDSDNSQATPTPTPNSAPNSSPTPTPSPDAPPAPAPAPQPTPSAEPVPAPNATPIPAPAPTAPPVATPVATPQPKSPDRTPSQPSEAPFTSVSVQCGKSGAAACPNEVGLLLAKSQGAFTQCTAFLVGEQMLMTNSHCLPNSLKVDGASCKSRIQVFFPQTDDQPAEYATCDRVIHASNIQVVGGKSGPLGRFSQEADYALLQLSSTTRRPSLEVSREGINDDMSLWIYSINPLNSDTEVGGVLQAHKCAARQNSLASPAFVQPLAPTAVVSGCAFIPGNSGSPAVDSQRRLRGILHAIVQKPVMSQAHLNEAHTFNPLALVTNFACTDLPAAAGRLQGLSAAACAQKFSENDLVRKTIKNADLQQLKPAIRQWLQTAPPELSFDFHRNDSPQSAKPLIAPSIKCLRSPENWLAKNSATSLSFNLPNWGFDWDVDADDRLLLIPEISLQQNAILQLNGQNAGSFAIGTLTITNPATGESLSSSNQYSACR
jgi:outer membrane biosynthesis protein TonB